MATNLQQQEKPDRVPVITGTPAQITTGQMSEMLGLLRAGNLRGALESAAFKEIKACHIPTVRSEMMEREDYHAIPTVLDNQPLLHNHVLEDQVQLKTTVSVSLSAEHYVRQVAEMPVRPTAPIRVLAPTGFGKTTRVPLLLSEKLKGSVLVIEPNVLTAQKAVGYVCSQDNQADLYGRDNTGAMVVYIPVNRFLATLVVNKRAFDKFSAIILDEAHHHGAAYVAAKSFLHARTEKWFVCYMTAMDGDHHANYQTVGPGVEKVEVPTLEYGQLEIPRDHPMHAKNIDSRVMLITPDTIHHDAYVTYYKQFGVHAVKLDADESLHMVNTVFEQLDQLAGNPAVLVVDPSYCEGITAPIDVVVDFCLRRTFVYDDGFSYFKSSLRAAMRHEKVQAAGRLGRLTTGTYYFMKRESPDIDVTDKHLDYIAVLWLRLLDIKPTHDFDKIVQYYTPITKMKALVLLASGIHPILMANYVDSTGCYKNYAEAIEGLVGISFPISVRTLKPERHQWNLVTKELNDGFVHYHSPYVYDAFGSEAIVRFLGVVHYLFQPEVKRLGAVTPSLITVSDSESDISDIPDIRPEVSEVGSSIKHWPVPFYGVKRDSSAERANSKLGFCQLCGCVTGDKLAANHLSDVGRYDWQQSHHQCQRMVVPGLTGVASFSTVTAENAHFTFFVHNQTYDSKRKRSGREFTSFRVGCNPLYPEEQKCYFNLLKNSDLLGQYNEMPQYMTKYVVEELCCLDPKYFYHEVCGQFVVPEVATGIWYIHIRPFGHDCDEHCCRFALQEVLWLGSQDLGPRTRDMVDWFVGKLVTGL